jgi:hypothetical protein
MANLNAKTLQTPAIETVAIPLSWAPNGTSAPDSAAFKGYISTVARSDTGLFTVTLKSGFPDIVSVQLTPQFNTKGGTGVTGQKWELGSISSTAGTIDLRLMNDGTTTLSDLAANANNVLHMTVFARNTSYTR